MADHRRTTATQLLDAGRSAEARARFAQDAAAAEASGDIAGFAEAAIGLGGLWVHEHRRTLDRLAVNAVQRRAAAALEHGSPAAIRLRARLAAEAVYVGSDLAPLRAEYDAARESGDPVAIAEVSSLLHHCMLGPHYACERRALVEELAEAATSSGRPRDALMALLWRTVNLHLAGHRRAPRALAELRELLGAHPCGAISYVAAALEVTAVMRTGALDRAEELARECLAFGLEVGDADALAWHAAQLLALRWMQGRLAEVQPVVAQLTTAATVPEGNDVFNAALAAAAAAAGDMVTAQSALASLRVHGLARLPRSSSWLPTMLSVSEAAHALQDRECAAEVAALLAPFADLPVMASLGIACFGSVRRPLGVALRTAGDLDGAIAHLEAAVFADLALGNRPAHAISLASLADALAARGQPGDLDAAGTAWHQAITAAQQMGMTARAERWLDAAERTRIRTVCSSVPGRGNQTRQTCQVALGVRSVAVAASVGIGYLAELMANPGRAIRAVDLVGGHTALVDGCKPAELLDPIAKAAYRAKIGELRAEIEDAESCADIGRAAIARDQLDQLIVELERATGLGGRSRAFSDDAERARVSVRKALTRALAAVGAQDPILAAEINERLATGALCTFHDAASAPGTCRR